MSRGCVHRWQVRRSRGPRVDPIQLLSASGTFLVTVAALNSLYAFVFDEAPQRGWATWSLAGGRSASLCRSAPAWRVA
jgi:hypothetical protein